MAETTESKSSYEKILDEYCGNNMQQIIKNLQNFYEKIAKENDEMQCCVCYDVKQKIQFTYLICGHHFCTTCYNLIIQKYNDRVCPLCRKQMFPIVLTNKYVIICPGDRTWLYEFDNGGLSSVYLFYFPEFEGHKYDVLSGITYHDDNATRSSYITKFIDLRCNEYCIIFRNFKQMTMWSNEIMIADFVPDIKFDLELVNLQIKE